VRENTEGMYSGIEKEFPDHVEAIRVISRKGCERILEFGFSLAKDLGEKKVTIVHKANILRKSCGLFRDIAFEVQKKFPGIEIEEVLVDAMAMRLVKHPENFKVIVTTNLFGDILSDEAVQLAGGLGLAPSANIGKTNAVFEPIHGSAPKYAGKGIANPIACILAGKMMLEYLGGKKLAEKISNAVHKTLQEGKFLPQDLNGKSSTKEVTNAIISNL
ncbi:MAG: isocitrate/isopropylmalate family dehydrogenase, partial [Candidatus Diapherotrites archaeon]|nr:isocitrate/isopropylmalate family dehydrogenase [Candidatus Diapherotrites archaeon]